MLSSVLHLDHAGSRYSSLLILTYPRLHQKILLPRLPASLFNSFLSLLPAKKSFFRPTPLSFFLRTTLASLQTTMPSSKATSSRQEAGPALRQQAEAEAASSPVQVSPNLNLPPTVLSTTHPTLVLDRQRLHPCLLASSALTDSLTSRRNRSDEACPPPGSRASGLAGARPVPQQSPDGGLQCPLQHPQQLR